jgi:vacuolar-type H+-ATPase subunit I/STV1
MNKQKVTTTEKLRGLKVEDLLNEELRREMGAEADPATGRLKVHQKLSQITDWEDIMHSVYELPIEFEGYTKKVSELQSLREMVDALSSQNFDNVKRSESRRKQLKEFVRTMHMYYNLVFSRQDEKTGYGALIYFPELKKDNAERSSGIVLVERKVIRGGKTDTRFERARFDDFLIDVKPYIEILGNLYRKSRRP